MIRGDRTAALHGALASLRALQEHVRSHVEGQLSGGDDVPGASREPLAELEARLAGHVRALDDTLARLGGEPAPLREAVGALVETVASWLQSARRREPASRMLRDVMAAVSLARIEARMLATLAEGLCDRVTARLADEQAAELGGLLDRLDPVLDDVLRAELEEAGKVQPGAGSAGASPAPR